MQDMDSVWMQEHPGYYYQWIAPLCTWGVKWMPIKNVYSPPVMDTSLSWLHMSIPSGINVIPIIGDGDMHFAKIAEETGASYIYYRQDLKKIEIWAQDTTTVMIRLTQWLNDIKIKHKSVSKLVPPFSS